MNDDDDDVVQSSLVAVVEIYGCVNDKEWSHLPKKNFILTRPPVCGPIIPWA